MKKKPKSSAPKKSKPSSATRKRSYGTLSGPSGIVGGGDSGGGKR